MACYINEEEKKEMLDDRRVTRKILINEVAELHGLLSVKNSDISKLKSDIEERNLFWKLEYDRIQREKVEMEQLVIGMARKLVHNETV